MPTGDRVTVKTDKESYEGTLMPEEPRFVLLKLDTGYNVGIAKERVKEIHVLDKHQIPPENKKQTTQDKTKPKITILHTGGTIASKVDYKTGAVIASFTPEELLTKFPELRDIATIESRLISNMFSEDMRFAHYNILGKECEKEINNGAQGIIITHGTDTLHYTAAALSFMLANTPIPIILVGAQRSSDRGSSDAGLNLIAAAAFITKTDFAEVAICMHESTNDNWCFILPGTKSRKLHSSRRDAFKAVNTTPWARIEAHEQKILWLTTGYHTRTPQKPTLRLFNENLKIGLLKTHTNMYAEQYLAYKNWNGLIIEGFGIGGHIPINVIDNKTKEHENITKAIKTLTTNGTIIAATTQTINGRLNMNVYSTGRHMQELNIIGHNTDMPAETAFIKLAWLLSNHPKNIKELYEKNLVGELNERSEE